MAADGTLFYLTTGALMKQGSSVVLDAGVSSLDELFSDGSLWQYRGGAWALLDRGVQAVGVSSDGALIDLEASGTLFSHFGSRWTLLDLGVTSFTLNGNTVIATDRSGGKTVIV